MANVAGIGNVPLPLLSSTDTVLGDPRGNSQVRTAVTAEVARRDSGWVQPYRVGVLGLERTVAVAQQ